MECVLRNLVGKVLIFLIFAAMPAEAFAQWFHTGKESAFGSGDVHVAATALDGRGFGVRCTGYKMEMLFTTQDKSVGEDDVEAFNKVNPKIRVRIDDDPIDVIDAEYVIFEGALGAIADTNGPMLRRLAGAKRRVAVVMTILGQDYHETIFNVRNSRKAIEKMMAGCGLGPAD